MALLRQCLKCTVVGFLLLFQIPVICYGVPDQIMSVVPSASSGTPILSSDENTRNSNISTPFNSHSHSDITQTGTALNIGASSGRSSIGDASVVLEGATNDANETTLTVVDPTADRTITFPNATGTVVLYGDTRVFSGSFTRDQATASGTQAITGVGFTPTSVIFFAGQSGSSETSVGFASGTADFVIFDAQGDVANTWANDLDDCILTLQSTGVSYTGDVLTFDSDGFTIDWVRTSTPTGTITVAYTAYR